MWDLIKNLVSLNSAIASKTRSIVAYDEGLAHYKAKDFKKAFPLIKEAAELGNPAAMSVLGAGYLMECWDSIDGQASEKWLLAAVEAGYQEAASVLGMGYATGKAGFPRNLELARRILTDAATAGDQQSAQMLQMMDSRTGIFARTK